MQGYEVFRGNAYDIMYTRDFYNLKDYSINLLRSREPIEQDETKFAQSII